MKYTMQMCIHESQYSSICSSTFLMLKMYQIKEQEANVAKHTV